MDSQSKGLVSFSIFHQNLSTRDCEPYYKSIAVAKFKIRVLICNKLCVQGLKEHNLGLMKEVNQLIEFNLNFRQEKVCSIHCSLSAFLRLVSFYMLIQFQ